MLSNLWSQWVLTHELRETSLNMFLNNLNFSCALNSPSYILNCKHFILHWKEFRQKCKILAKILLSTSEGGSYVNDGKKLLTVFKRYRQYTILVCLHNSYLYIARCHLCTLHSMFSQYFWISSQYGRNLLKYLSTYN